MKKRNQDTQSQNYLYRLILGSLQKYYPWLLVVGIAALFLFPSSLFNTASPKPETRVETIVKETKVNYSKYPKILVFMADKSNRGKGKLMAVNTKEAKIDGTWDAVSGIGGNEDQPGRGPTPSNTKLKFDHYTVTVKPLYLNQPGIYGNFYQILPFSFQINGRERGNFGVHADRTAPGTLGCVGIKDGPQWEDFKQLMSEYEKAGLTKIPLLVSHR